MQNVYRYWASGHSENIRGAAAVIAQNARPGDAVLFLPESRRVVKLGYPDAFRAVDDVALAESAQDSATLWGIEDPADELAAALHERYRVWVVTGVARYGETPTATTREKERLLYDGFRVAGVTTTGRYEVRLYERDRAAADAVSTPAS
jgi:mannosyltransferase